MKKTISLLLAICMIFVSGITVFAATVTPAITPKTIEAGQVVTLTLSLDEQITNVSSFEYTIDFDETKFTYKSGVGGNATSGVEVFENDDANKTCSVVYVFAGAGSVAGTVNAGTLATIEFVAKEDIVEKDDVTFTVTKELFDNPQGEIPNVNLSTTTLAATVTPKPIAVTDVRLNKTELELEVGATETLVATVYPENATNKNVTWKTSNDGYVSVENGVLTAKAAGVGKVTTITVETVDGKITATCTVKVVCTAHTGGTANCKELAKCTICGSEYGTLDASNHKETTTTVVPNNNGTHDVKYNCCGALKEDNTACTGGTATCTEKAKCTVCGGEHGELNATNHVGTATVIVPNNDGTHDVKYSVCGHVANDNVTCSGGTATCQAKAKCSVCGGEYGNLGAHNFETGWSKKDDDNHGHKCQTAGCTEFDAVEKHEGGTATCIEKAECTKCKSLYGNLLEHDYDETKWVDGGDNKHYHFCKTENCIAKKDGEAHKGGEATCTEQAVCSECNEKYGKLLEHVDENKDDKCDKCGFNMRKPEGCDHKLDKDGKCSRCGIIIITYDGDKPSNGNESNPNTGAPAPASAVAAVAVLAAAAYVASKRK